MPEADTLRPAALAACLALVACTAADERPAPAHPPATSPDAASVTGLADAEGRPLDALAPALSRLDAALVAHLDPALAWDMDAPLAEAREAIRAACETPPSEPACAAARVALDTLGAWHGVIVGAATVDPAGRAALEQALLSSLGAVAGQIPQTETMAALIELESGREADGAERLAALLARPGPAGAAHGPAHALARAFRDTVPDPLVLVPPLLAEPAAVGGEAYRDDRAPATAGLLHLAAGLRAAAEGDASRAATLYEQGAAHLDAASDRDPMAASFDIDGWRADCLVNAGWLHYTAAQEALDAGGMEGARAYLEAAEADFSEAYATLPDDAEARRGVALTGDLYYQAGDLPGIRDYFGRAARRFDDPEWWNNHAFFCRETEQYERSYEAYERCIALAPENARWANDTGLILLYHLQRDLDRAEALFRRAVDLGRKVEENAFADEEAVQEAFLARTDAMLNLGRLWLEQGRLDEAAAIVGDLLAESPERPDANMLAQAIEQARASASDPDAVPESADPEG